MRDRLLWVAAAFVVALLWMWRYDVPDGNPQSRLILLDRWTGTVYVMAEGVWVPIRAAGAERAR